MPKGMGYGAGERHYSDSMEYGKKKGSGMGLKKKSKKMKKGEVGLKHMQNMAGKAKKVPKKKGQKPARQAASREMAEMLKNVFIGPKNQHNAKVGA